MSAEQQNLATRKMVLPENAAIGTLSRLDGECRSIISTLTGIPSY